MQDCNVLCEGTIERSLFLCLHCVRVCVYVESNEAGNSFDSIVVLLSI